VRSPRARRRGAAQRLAIAVIVVAVQNPGEATPEEPGAQVGEETGPEVVKEGRELELPDRKEERRRKLGLIAPQSPLGCHLIGGIIEPHTSRTIPHLEISAALKVQGGWGQSHTQITQGGPQESQEEWFADQTRSSTTEEGERIGEAARARLNGSQED